MKYDIERMRDALVHSSGQHARREVYFRELLEEIKYLENVNYKLDAVVRSWNSGVHHIECDACHITEEAFEASKNRNEIRIVVNKDDFIKANDIELSDMIVKSIKENK